MIYLDNHATTPCDRRVVDAMLPWLLDDFGNPHSSSHEVGRTAASAVDGSANQIGDLLNVPGDSVLFTSGATESNNLAIEGICRHPRQKKRHLVITSIEHHAVLDVAKRLEKDGFRVSIVAVHPHGHPHAGQVDLDELASVLDDDVALVSVHWANNEIGVIQPMAEIADLVHQHGALLHSDATQAVGRIPVDLRETDVDLISATAHKFYGPKGSGILTTGGGRAGRRIRMRPMFVGGGQQSNLRSGTVAPANAVAIATALRLAISEMSETIERQTRLREMLWQGLSRSMGVSLNGLPLDSSSRLSGNLHVRLPGIEGAAWMAAVPGVAFSSGSACSSVEALPSHVLLGMGLSESEARRSVRFGIGKFNQESDIVAALEQLESGYSQIGGGDS